MDAWSADGCNQPIEDAGRPSTPLHLDTASIIHHCKPLSLGLIANHEKQMQNTLPPNGLAANLVGSRPATLVVLGCPGSRGGYRHDHGEPGLNPSRRAPGGREKGARTALASRTRPRRAEPSRLRALIETEVCRALGPFMGSLEVRELSAVLHDHRGVKPVRGDGCATGLDYPDHGVHRESIRGPGLCWPSCHLREIAQDATACRI